MLAYVFERFPKFSQTFCYREVVELFGQGEKPAIFSLRSPDLGPEQSWDDEILKVVHVLPEGDEFAKAVDAESHKIPKVARKILREWRGRRDSLRLHWIDKIEFCVLAGEADHSRDRCINARQLVLLPKMRIF